MIPRIITASILGICLLTVPMLPAFGQQNQQGQNGQRGQNGQQGQNGQRTAVPEPSTALLLALGVGGVVALDWLRRQRAV